MSLQDSELPGAGGGLFARRQPPTRTWEEGEVATRQVVIRKNDQVCLYAKRPLTHPTQVTNADYSAQAPRNPRKVYESSIYDGSNIGRFANDAGLLPGFVCWWSSPTKLPIQPGLSGVPLKLKQRNTAMLSSSAPVRQLWCWRLQGTFPLEDPDLRRSILAMGSNGTGSRA